MTANRLRTSSRPDKRFARLTLCGVLALLALSGCTRGDDLPVSPRTVVPGRSLLALAAQTPTVPSVSFEPPSASLCGAAPPPEPVVQWDATASSPTGVILAYMVPGSPWRRWQRASSKGRASTGAWVRPGTTFAVIDSRKNKVLAQAAYGWAACTGPASR